MAVFSATQMFQELDLLEIRLETLDSVVDFFVISESTKTHSGLDKPLYYNENKDRYKKFDYKIIHQIIDNTPKNIEECLKLNNPYAKKVIKADWFDKNVESYIRDTYEKEVLLRALEFYAKEGDIILFGDLDEIPSREAIQTLKENFDKDSIYYFKQDLFYYYLNLQKTNENWASMLALSYDRLIEEDKSLCEMRTNKNGKIIYNAGWHFAYMGGVEKIKQKINSWGEQSLNLPHIHNALEENVKHAIEYGRDLFFRPATWKVRNINDGTFPEYLVDNQDKFEQMLL